MEILRTFIAVPIKPENEFLKARAELMELLGRERISWVDPERYHITIRFLGDSPPDVVNKIRSAMKEGIQVPAKGRTGLGKAASFGPGKNPRVIWLGFTDSSIFDSLRKEVDSALELCGIPRADQAFRAHLTLGRIRGLKDRKGFYRIMDSLKDRFSGEVPVDRLVFYKSELRNSGPLYTPLEELFFPDQSL